MRRRRRAAPDPLSAIRVSARWDPDEGAWFVNLNITAPDGSVTIGVAMTAEEGRDIAAGILEGVELAETRPAP